MPDFNADAYSRTVDLFTGARNARVSLPSLKMQLSDCTSMIGSPRIDGMPKPKNPGNVTEAKIIGNMGALSLMERRIDEYQRLIFDAERVIESMEQFGEGDGGDAAFLRYYYLMGMTQAEAARRAGYSENYRKEKASIALVHASFAVERLGIFE